MKASVRDCQVQGAVMVTWVRLFVEEATRKSHIARTKRQEKARRRYKEILNRLPDNRITSGNLKAFLVSQHGLGIKPSSAAKVLQNMQKYGLLRKAKHVPQHWEYERVDDASGTLR